jgi:hypothetical protein
MNSLDDGFEKGSHARSKESTGNERGQYTSTVRRDRCAVCILRNRRAFNDTRKEETSDDWLHPYQEPIRGSPQASAQAQSAAQ